MNSSFIFYIYALIMSCSVTCGSVAMEVTKEDNSTMDLSQTPSPNRNILPNSVATIQYKVGLSYFEGKNIPQDYTKAADYFNLSADQGHPEAILHLGYMFIDGLGVAKAPEKAFNYFKSLAEIGDSFGQCNLGICYVNGIGHSRAPEMAEYYLKLSAKQRNRIGQFTLGLCYATNKGFGKNLTKAVKYYQRASDQGHPVAHYNLGLCYQYGQGVPQDTKQAIHYYKKADAQGHKDSHEALLDLEKLFPDLKIFGTSSEDSSLDTTENELDYQDSIIFSKGDKQKCLYDVVIKLLEHNPTGALTLLREAEKDGCPDSKKYLSKLRKSKSYKNNTKMNAKSYGAILKSMESTNTKPSNVKQNQQNTAPKQSNPQKKKKKKTKTPIIPTRNNTNSENQMSELIETANILLNTNTNYDLKEENKTELVSGEGPSQETVSPIVTAEIPKKKKTLSRAKSPLVRRNSENNLPQITEKTKERKELNRSLTVTDKFRKPEIKAEEKSEEKSRDSKEKKPKKSSKNNANPTRELKRKNSERKLERKISQSNLITNNEDISETEQSAAETEPRNLYIQEGTRDTDLKRLKKLLNDRDLVVASDIKLTDSLVRRVLRELSDKKVISWNFEKDKVKGDKITATHCQNQKIALTIHLHGMWWTRSDIKESILDFIRRCDSGINDLIVEIETKKSQKQF